MNRGVFLAERPKSLPEPESLPVLAWTTSRACHAPVERAFYNGSWV